MDKMASAEVVELDVGGFIYKTTKQTLLSIEQTYFTILLGGNWTVETDKNGRIFIDRDGKAFEYALDYLRNNIQMVLPEKTEMKERVRREADFYGLMDLSKMMKSINNIIELNVGGFLYTTTRDTLTCQGTFFSRLFKNDSEKRTDKDGRVFIDRDGKAFQYILCYLQTFRQANGGFLPENAEMRQRVQREAQFYGLYLY